MAVRLAVVAGTRGALRHKAEVPGRWQLVPRNPGTLGTGADPCQAVGGADVTALVIRRRRPKRRRRRQSSCLEPIGAAAASNDRGALDYRENKAVGNLNPPSRCAAKQLNHR